MDLLLVCCGFGWLLVEVVLGCLRLRYFVFIDLVVGCYLLAGFV